MATVQIAVTILFVCVCVRACLLGNYAHACQLALYYRYNNGYLDRLTPKALNQG